MKKITLSFLAIFAVFSLFAQTVKGSWLAGGNIGFTSSKEDQFKSSIFQIAPDFGYFFINNLAAGLNVNFISVHTHENENSSTASNIAAGPFLRYYFNTGQQVKIFAEGNAAWGSMKNGDNIPNESSSTYGFKAGPAFFLNPHVALEITAGYQSMKVKDPDFSSTTNTFAIGAGFQIHLGK